MRVPEGEAVLLFAGSACSRKFCATAAAVPLLNAEAVNASGLDACPDVAVAFALAGRFSLPRTFIADVPV